MSVTSEPVGYKQLLDWKILASWNCYRVETVGDGSCLFHALYNGVAEEYRRCDYSYNGQLIRELRQELATKLSPEIYSRLAQGNLAQEAAVLAHEMEEAGDSSSDLTKFTHTGMVALLASHAFIGTGFIEYIGDMLGLDIYILNAETKDVYVHHEARYCYKDRPSVVVLCYPPQPLKGDATQDSGGHYELVAMEVGGVSYSRWFPDHPFIVMLRQRLQTTGAWEK